MEKIKAISTAIIGTVTSWLGALAAPVFMLVLCNVIDYITGILASKYRGQEITSYKGIQGITKKVCMWLLIVVGAIVDELARYAIGQIGYVIPFTFMVACIVAIWLVCNEIISILENLKDIGVPLPDFLVKLTKNIKSQIEVKTDVINEEENSR